MKYVMKHMLIVMMLLLMTIYLISCTGNANTSSQSGSNMAKVGPPSQPIGVIASGGDSHVDLRWTPPENATSYNLYWSMTSGVTVTSNRILNVSMPFTHMDLANDTTYHYCVSAVNVYGESGLSDEVQATPKEPFTNILTKVTDPDTEDSDLFGYAVSIDGNYAIVGAPQSDVESLNGIIADAGAAYIFQKSLNGAWDKGFRIVASDPDYGGMFGRRVSISGDYVIVGAPYTTGGGAAYIFHRTDSNIWDAGIKLGIPLDAGGSLSFGYDVAISGDYAVVSDVRMEQVFVFRRTEMNTWNDVARLSWPSEVEVLDNFGISVAISGDYLIVGAYHDSGVSNMTASIGAAYIFRRTGTNIWGNYTKIMAFDGEAQDMFGRSVAISREYAIVGTSNKPSDTGSTIISAGAAYIFHRIDENLWDEGAKVMALDPQAYDRFARSVAISDQYALVGAFNEDCGWDENAEEGAAYLYKRIGTNSWDSGTKITIPAGDTADYFGYAVAISGESAIIGAFGDDGSVSETIYEAGAAYLY